MRPGQCAHSEQWEQQSETNDLHGIPSQGETPPTRVALDDLKPRSVSVTSCRETCCISRVTHALRVSSPQVHFPKHRRARGKSDRREARSARASDGSWPCVTFQSLARSFPSSWAWSSPFGWGLHSTLFCENSAPAILRKLFQRGFERGKAAVGERATSAEQRVRRRCAASARLVSVGRRKDGARFFIPKDEPCAGIVGRESRQTLAGDLKVLETFQPQVPAVRIFNQDVVGGLDQGGHRSCHSSHYLLRNIVMEECK